MGASCGKSAFARSSERQPSLGRHTVVTKSGLWNKGSTISIEGCFKSKSELQKLGVHINDVTGVVILRITADQTSEKEEKREIPSGVILEPRIDWGRLRVVRQFPERLPMVMWPGLTMVYGLLTAPVESCSIVRLYGRIAHGQNVSVETDVHQKTSMQLPKTDIDKLNDMIRTYQAKRSKDSKMIDYETLRKSSKPSLAYVKNDPCAASERLPMTQSVSHFSSCSSDTGYNSESGISIQSDKKYRRRKDTPMKSAWHDPTCLNEEYKDKMGTYALKEEPEEDDDWLTRKRRSMHFSRLSSDETNDIIIRHPRTAELQYGKATEERKHETLGSPQRNSVTSYTSVFSDTKEPRYSSYGLPDQVIRSINTHSRRNSKSNIHGKSSKSHDICAARKGAKSSIESILRRSSSESIQKPFRQVSFSDEVSTTETEATEQKKRAVLRKKRRSKKLSTSGRKTNEDTKPRQTKLSKASFEGDGFSDSPHEIERLEDLRERHNSEIDAERTDKLEINTEACIDKCNINKEFVKTNINANDLVAKSVDTEPAITTQVTENSKDSKVEFFAAVGTDWNKDKNIVGRKRDTSITCSLTDGAVSSNCKLPSLSDMMVGKCDVTVHVHEASSGETSSNSFSHVRGDDEIDFSQEQRRKQDTNSSEAPRKDKEREYIVTLSYDNSGAAQSGSTSSGDSSKIKEMEESRDMADSIHETKSRRDTLSIKETQTHEFHNKERYEDGMNVSDIAKGTEEASYVISTSGKQQSGQSNKFVPQSSTSERTSKTCSGSPSSPRIRRLTPVVNAACVYSTLQKKKSSLPLLEENCGQEEEEPSKTKVISGCKGDNKNEQCEISVILSPDPTVEEGDSKITFEDL